MENDVVETPMLENIQILVLNNCGVTWELVYQTAVTLKLLLLVIASHTVSSF
jgi:low affinity Fe/Cu permease